MTVGEGGQSRSLRGNVAELCCPALRGQHSFSPGQCTTLATSLLSLLSAPLLPTWQHVTNALRGRSGRAWWA